MDHPHRPSIIFLSLLTYDLKLDTSQTGSQRQLTDQYHWRDSPTWVTQGLLPMINFGSMSAKGLSTV